MESSEQKPSADDVERIEEEIYFDDDDDILDERTIQREKSRIMREINRNKERQEQERKRQEQERQERERQERWKTAEQERQKFMEKERQKQEQKRQERERQEQEKQKQEQERQEQEQKKIERDEIIWEATNCLIASEQLYDSISCGVWGNKLMSMSPYTYEYPLKEIHPSLRGQFSNLANIPHYGLQSLVVFLNLLMFSHNQLEMMINKAIEIKNILENYSQSDYDKDYKEKRAETGGRDGDAQRAILQKVKSFISASLSSVPPPFHSLINQFSFFCLTPNFKVIGIYSSPGQDMMLYDFNYNTVVISVLNRINCLINFLSKIHSLKKLSGGLKKRKTKKTKKTRKIRKTRKTRKTKNYKK
jgi:hypothetical protein